VPPEQLDVIEAALRLMLNPPKPAAVEPEVIPPGSAREDDNSRVR
jgi:hypothetical protein